MGRPAMRVKYSPEEYRAMSSKWRLNSQQGARSALATLKLEAGCMDCGYNTHPDALQFDHRPGEGKAGSIVEVYARNGLAAALDEAEKCDIVCANCHAVRTAIRRMGGTSGS